jgi:hypothetical protein
MLIGVKRAPPAAVSGVSWVTASNQVLPTFAKKPSRSAADTRRLNRTNFGTTDSGQSFSAGRPSICRSRLGAQLFDLAIDVLLHLIDGASVPAAKP